MCMLDFNGKLKLSFRLTRFILDLHPTDPLTHGDEGVVVLLQALVCFLVQASEGPELGPVEFLPLGVIDHSKGGHHPVEICLFTTSPPSRSRDTHTHG